MKFKKIMAMISVVVVLLMSTLCTLPAFANDISSSKYESFYYIGKQYRNQLFNAQNVVTIDDSKETILNYYINLYGDLNCYPFVRNLYQKQEDGGWSYSLYYADVDMFLEFEKKYGEVDTWLTFSYIETIGKGWIECHIVPKGTSIVLNEKNVPIAETSNQLHFGYYFQWANPIYEDYQDCFTFSYYSSYGDGHFLSSYYNFNDNSNYDWKIISTVDIVNSEGEVVVESSNLGNRPLVSSSDFTVTANPIFTDDLEMVTTEEVIGKRENYTITSSTESVKVELANSDLLEDNNSVQLLPIISTADPSMPIEQIYNEIVYVPYHNDYYISHIRNTNDNYLTINKNGIDEKIDFDICRPFFNLISAETLNEWMSVTAGGFYLDKNNNSIPISYFNFLTPYLNYGVTPFYNISSSDVGKNYCSIVFDWSKIKLNTNETYYFYLFSYKEINFKIDGNSKNYISHPIGNIRDFFLSDYLNMSYCVSFGSKNIPSYDGDDISISGNHLDGTFLFKPTSSVSLKYDMEDNGKVNDYYNLINTNISVDSSFFDNISEDGSFIDSSLPSNSYLSPNFDISSVSSLMDSLENFKDFLSTGFSFLPAYFWSLLGTFFVVLIFLRIGGR